MKYETTISLTYSVPVYTDKKLTRDQVLAYIMENVVITDCDLIEVDYDGADVEACEETTE
jgi:hypothetical protein